jgi:hypothetical protein
MHLSDYAVRVQDKSCSSVKLSRASYRLKQSGLATAIFANKKRNRRRQLECVE